jgi:hypothetical protein
VVDRSFRGALAVTAGAATILIGTFLPWLRSGSRDRSSYAIFELVERLGFAPGGLVAWSLRLWPLVPLLLVAVTIAAWAVMGRHVGWRVVALLAAGATVWVGGTAGALFAAPDIGLFRVGIGPTVALLGIVALVVGTIWLRRPRSDASAAA